MKRYFMIIGLVSIFMPVANACPIWNGTFGCEKMMTAVPVKTDVRGKYPVYTFSNLNNVIADNTEHLVDKYEVVASCRADTLEMNFSQPPFGDSTCKTNAAIRHTRYIIKSVKNGFTFHETDADTCADGSTALAFDNTDTCTTQ